MQRISEQERQFQAVGVLKYLKKGKKTLFKHLKIIILILFCIAIFITFVMLHHNKSEENNYFVTQRQVFDYNEEIQILKTQQERSHEERFEIQGKKNKKWNIQKIVWVYKRSQELMTEKEKNSIIERRQIFQQMNMRNTKHFAEQDNYKYIVVDDRNYTSYLSKENARKITNLFSVIQDRLKNEKNVPLPMQLTQNKDLIKKRVIVYFLLLQNGGIFVDSKMTVLQTFSTWVQKVMTLPYINVGDKIDSQIDPKCFGFFHTQFSSFKSKFNVKREFEFEKQMVIFPSLEDQFLACSKGSQYLQKLTEYYLNVLIQKQFSPRLNKLNTNQNLVGKTTTGLMYKHGHLLAHHIVLQQRQSQLDQKSIGPYKELAIDNFGLVTINTFLGPRKIQHTFSNPQNNFERGFIFLSKLMTNQLEKHLGKLRFVSLLRDEVTDIFINKMLSPQSKLNFFVEKSFMHTYFLKYIPEIEHENAKDSIFVKRNQDMKFLLNNFNLKKVQFDQKQNINNPAWQSFPKHIWTIWDSGIKKNSNFLVELCQQNLKRSAQKSGFQMHTISNHNIEQYLDKQTLKRINYTIKHATFELSRQAISDIWRLALLSTHGGIYLDSTSYTMNQSFDWIKNITRMPSTYIWNRFGNEPDVFMMWNPYFANEMNWYIDKKFKTKSVWHLSYESSFIVAKKNSSFVKDWFDLYLEWIVTPYPEVQQQMMNVSMFGYQWTQPGHLYLLVMDAVKYIIARKQRSLQNQTNSQYDCASDYYKIWSLPGQYTGLLKFRHNQNYESLDYRYSQWFEGNGKYIYRYEYPLEYTESVKGQVLYMSKFFESGFPVIDMLMSYYDQHRNNFTMKLLDKIIHPRSLLATKVLNRYPDKTMYLLEYYSNSVRMRRQYKLYNHLNL